ncbi:hypothetical protein Glove_26g166 [Diversispora epigaea]|uniref:SRR1-like domain-containing protein n=1 Tax=Diversispora epigaea TaxID=1348612 RepID=A0A397JL96_9GLOM|nr:hypothetical protein Glove_26g166 [Diversispora epigaea]
MNDFKYNTFTLSKKKKRRHESRKRSKTIEEIVSFVKEKSNILLKSKFYIELKEGIKYQFLPPHRPNIVDIVAYGIGSIQDSNISQYQFALLLIFKNIFQITGRIYAFDPKLTQIDIEALNYFEVELIKTNEKAKRSIINQTLFFMPHCPLGLYNNLIKSNWDINKLENIIIFGNRLKFYEEIMTKATLDRKAPHLIIVIQQQIHRPITRIMMIIKKT